MSQYKVMIVDNDPNCRALLCDALGDEPYTLVEAADGQQALDLANQELPDLILLDIKMPGINGVGVLHELKEQEQTCDIPVIMVTAFTLDTQMSACLEDGAVDYICKPFTSTGVRARVRAALRARSRAETANITRQLRRAETANFTRQLRSWERTPQTVS